MRFIWQTRILIGYVIHLVNQWALQCIGTSIAGAVGTTVVAVGNIAVLDVNGILELVFAT